MRKAGENPSGLSREYGVSRATIERIRDDVEVGEKKPIKNIKINRAIDDNKDIPVAEIWQSFNTCEPIIRRLLSRSDNQHSAKEMHEKHLSNA